MGWFGHHFSGQLGELAVHYRCGGQIRSGRDHAAIRHIGLDRGAVGRTRAYAPICTPRFTVARMPISVPSPTVTPPAQGGPGGEVDRLAQYAVMRDNCTGVDDRAETGGHFRADIGQGENLHTRGPVRRCLQ